MMFVVIKKKKLIKKSDNKILKNNLSKNSKWISLNNLLIQFYDLFDKYLIKIFIGPDRCHIIFCTSTINW